MREFLLYSRTGRTDTKFGTLAEGGRLDVFHQCAVMAIFKAQAHRHDVVFHAVLNGPPNPPVHVRIEGSELRDVRVDESSWASLLKRVLGGSTHPGVSVDRQPFQRIVKEKAGQGYKIFVLSSKGSSVNDKDLTGNSLFVLGDHVGLPRKDEGFALRYGDELSLGRQKYLAAGCIGIINYIIDRNEGESAEGDAADGHQDNQD